MDEKWAEIAFNYIYPTFCDQIVSITAKIECKDNIYFSIAISGNNITYCDEISNPGLVSECKEAIQG